MLSPGGVEPYRGGLPETLLHEWFFLGGERSPAIRHYVPRIVLVLPE